MTIKTEKDFQDIGKHIVRMYTLQHMDKADDVPKFDVYCVWYVKVLQNFKGLFSTDITDGMYYEVTYSGDKDEIYLDAYKRFENKCIKANAEN